MGDVTSGIPTSWRAPDPVYIAYAGLHPALDSAVFLTGGKFGLPFDADGPYVLLAGIQAVFVTAATLSFAARHPFPRDGPTCG